MSAHTDRIENRCRQYFFFIHIHITPMCVTKMYLHLFLYKHHLVINISAFLLTFIIKLFFQIQQNGS